MTRNDELKAGQGLSVERVRALLDGRTPGEWKVYKYWNGRLDVHSPTGEDDTCTSVITYPTAVDVELLALAPALGEALISSEARVEAVTLERDRLAHELRLLREAVETASRHQLAHLVGAPLPVHDTDLGTHCHDDQHPHQHLYAALHRPRGEEGDQDGATGHQSNLAQGTPDQAPQRTAGDQDEGQCGDATQPQGKRHMLPSRDVLRGHRGVVTDALLSSDTPERSGGEG
ncbi:hypothetical protein [uncultured Deinococcus sp.]|uniref:hypothetical protein n=1 Tax=uncultured Deinococcus sp. TaxID=158789 RepID=UPI00258D865A|nr:hypothetical protein [uncultured Deinococcus sp.]